MRARSERKRVAPMGPRHSGQPAFAADLQQFVKGGFDGLFNGGTLPTALLCQGTRLGDEGHAESGTQEQPNPAALSELNRSPPPAGADTHASVAVYGALAGSKKASLKAPSPAMSVAHRPSGRADLPPRTGHRPGRSGDTLQEDDLSRDVCDDRAGAAGVAAVQAVCASRVSHGMRSVQARSVPPNATPRPTAEHAVL